MTRAARTVFTLCTSAQPRSRHERASQAWVARRLASIMGWAFGGEYDPRRPRARAGYFVPDETLTAEQAARLGVVDETDLFGGVVPHAFIASKVITHPLPAPDSTAPAGWKRGLADDLAGAVLPGFSVFDPAAIEPAARQLFALGGPVRLKEPLARGGIGQHLLADAIALREVAAGLDPDAVRRDGVVLEQHLDGATTRSVGEIRVGGCRLAYLGTQHQAEDRSGRQTYAGSSLRVVPGGLDALEAIAIDVREREALRSARRYDAAVATAWPELFASRRNYDVVVGHDAHGRWRCGVLEQSWRLGGASPAEVLALAVLRRPDAPAVLDVSCHESRDPDQALPPGAEVHFHDAAATRGPLLKYARVDAFHGNPA